MTMTFAQLMDRSRLHRLDDVIESLARQLVDEAPEDEKERVKAGVPFAMLGAAKVFAKRFEITTNRTAGPVFDRHCLKHCNRILAELRGTLM